ncbi:MAG: FHA domain-containing protein, partial [Eggerthellaceae bacterium]|nr:FHA domain-containing protein [Eggerthellaceae bacterium]
LSPRFSQIDDQRTLTYDVTSLHPASEYFFGHVFNRSQWLEVLIGTTEGFLEAQDYMLDERAFAGTLDYLFIDEYLHPRLIYTPVQDFVGGGGAQALLREVATRMAADRTVGDISYLSDVQATLEGADFDLRAFKKQLVALTLRPNASGGASDAFREMQGTIIPGTMGATPVQDRSTPPAGGGGTPYPVPGGLPVQPQPVPVTPPVGQPLEFNGMAVPPADGQAGGAASGTSVPVPPESEDKGGLFGIFKRKSKGQDAAGAGESKHAKPKKEKPAKEKKSFFSFGKKDASAGAHDASFAIPGADPMAGLGSRVQNPPDPIQPSVSGQLGFVSPAKVDYAPSDHMARVDYGDGPDGVAQDAMGVVQSSVPGEVYVDNDFGLTEVHGIPSVAKKGDQGIVFYPVEQKKPSMPEAYLTCANTGKDHALSSTPYRIGRRKSAVELHVPGNSGVSRVHAIITFDGTDYSVSDNNSANHTFVNSRQLTAGEKQRLVDGDRIRFADEDYVFHLGSASK